MLRAKAIDKVPGQGRSTRAGRPLLALGVEYASWYPGIVWFGKRRPFTFAALAAVGTLIVLMTVLAIVL